MHLRNFEDLFFIDKVWRRWCVSLEKKTFGAFNWHVYQSLHCSQCPGWIQKISTNCSCSLSLDGSIDFVEHTVCRVSEVSVADAQRLSLTRHGWGAQDEVDRRIQGRRFDTLCHTFAETAPTFLLSRTFIPNNSLALIAFSQGGMIAFASAHNPNWPGFSKSSKFSILEWISSRSFR